MTKYERNRNSGRCIIRVKGEIIIHSPGELKKKNAWVAKNLHFDL